MQQISRNTKRNLQVSFDFICCIMKHLLPLSKRSYIRIVMEGYKKGWYVPFLLAIVDKTNLCTRADNAVQKVKSGKFKLIGMNVNGLSGFTSCVWCGFLFHISFSMGFTRTLLSGNVDTESPHHISFVSYCSFIWQYINQNKII